MKTPTYFPTLKISLTFFSSNTLRFVLACRNLLKTLLKEFLEEKSHLGVFYHTALYLGQKLLYRGVSTCLKMLYMISSLRTLVDVVASVYWGTLRCFATTCILWLSQRPATHFSIFLISHSVSKCFMKKNVKSVNIPLHTFCHFHEILILCKRPLTFIHKIAISSKITWNMQCEKDTLWNVPEILYALLTVSYFVIVSFHYLGLDQ